MKLICFEVTGLGSVFVRADSIVAIIPAESGSVVHFAIGSEPSYATTDIDPEELASLIERFVPEANIIYLR